jgi:probable HAF family extracellular repeat protein
MQRYTLAALAVLALLVPAQQALKADQALYTIDDLGTLGGLAPTITGVNDSGEMSGFVGTSTGSRAVRYVKDSGWEFLPGLGTGFSEAYGINAAGDIVGYHFTATGQRAFRFHAGTIQDIDPPAGGTMTVGYAINSRGDVVGYADGPGGVIVPFLANPGLPAAPLASPSSFFAVACGVNDADQVAGFWLTNEGYQHAMRIDPDSGPADLPSVDGPTGFSSACAIDSTGQVGGQADSQGVARAFRARAGKPLDNIDGFASTGSNVEAIVKGRSVGWFFAQGGTQRAFTYTDDNGGLDLNTAIPSDSGWVLSVAKGVTASGEIIGEGLKDGVRTTFRLTPVAAPKDTTPPVITSLTATPSIIFPPKGQKVTVTVKGEATDDSGVMPVCTLTSVTGPGAAGVDFEVTGANTASVAAVGGRTYSMNVTCVDASDNAASQSVDVFVQPDTTAPVIASVTATPSTIWPPDGSMKPVTVTVTASDDVDDQPLCYLSDVTAAGAAAGDSVIRGTFSADVRAVGGRTYAMNVSCSDRAGNHSARSVNVVVPPDTTAPVITELSVTPNAIWPPNGKMVPVQVSVSATDDVDAAPSCALSSISGSSADATITGAFTANVRALKSSDEYDRVYVLTVTCSDRAKNKSSRTVNVVVTKNDPSLNYSGKSGKGKSGK